MPYVSRRGFGQGALAAGLVAAATDLRASTGTATNMSPEVERAWRFYMDSIEWARQFIYTREFSDNPRVKAAANQFIMQLQAVTYNWVMAPRVDYPRFFLGLFEPMVWNWAQPSADFRYRWAFIDGRQTYRIWGKRGTANFLDIQLQPSIGSVDLEAFRKLPTVPYPVDKMHLGSDGSFEIIASPDHHEGNWIKLDPAQDRVTLFVREAFYDWAGERPSLMRIERVASTPPAAPLWDEAEFIKHVMQAGRFVRFVADQWGVAGFDATFEAQGREWNKFIWQHPPANAGTNHAAIYHNMVYNLADDEALIIEVDRPSSQYWSFCLADRYLQLSDFTYHQSSLNGHQAKIDRDGKFRGVLTSRDPGVPNWIDPVDARPYGFIQLRQYFQAESVALPVVKRVKFDEVRRNLPGETPIVSPAERAQQLHDRAWSVLALYGY